MRLCPSLVLQFADRSIRFLSEEGRCYSFDSRGSGYGRGEGVASIVIKPLRDAIANGDPIRAIIRNTAINQDGRTPGLTMPSREAQMTLIQDAYSQAGLDPLLTRYVEAHGTGTKVGDPIEVDAIAAALSTSRDPAKPLLIGSVKANIGHLESASGLAGFIKAVLCLEKGMIPPSANFKVVNPALRLEEKSMKVSHLQHCLPVNWLIDYRLQESLNNGLTVACAGRRLIVLAMVVPMHMLS